MCLKDKTSVSQGHIFTALLTEAFFIVAKKYEQPRCLLHDEWIKETCVFVYVFMYVFLCVHLDVCMCVCVCISVCIHVFVCVHVCS